MLAPPGRERVELPAVQDALEQRGRGRCAASIAVDCAFCSASIPLSTGLIRARRLRERAEPAREPLEMHTPSTKWAGARTWARSASGRAWRHEVLHSFW